MNESANFSAVNIASKVLMIFAVCIFMLAITTLALVVYNEAATIEHENVVKSRLSIQSVVAIIENFKAERGSYPEDLSELTGIYLTRVPLDIWGNPYHYEYNREEDSYRVYTLGYGGTPGGDKNQRDYDNNTNWELVY